MEAYQCSLKQGLLGFELGLRSQVPPSFCLCLTKFRDAPGDGAGLLRSLRPVAVCYRHRVLGRCHLLTAPSHAAYGLGREQRPRPRDFLPQKF